MIGPLRDFSYPGNHMTESEISDLAHALARTTPLSRLNHAEAIAVVAKMTELAIVTALPVQATS